MDPKQLLAEFPRDAISWRCQSVSKAGDKGLALAYIDARDVMRRLDEVCGQTGWQDRYEVHGTKTLCYLSLFVPVFDEGNQWITKADGAGDTDVEAEKGSLSDAFKRAAVKWGIGRYLYEVPAPWVPCKTYEAGGKKRWSEWTADPWSFVRQPRPAAISAPAPKPQADNRETPEQTRDRIELALTDAETVPDLERIAAELEPEYLRLPEAMQAAIGQAYSFKEQALRAFGEAA